MTTAKTAKKAPASPKKRPAAKKPIAAKTKTPAVAKTPVVAKTPAVAETAAVAAAPVAEQSAQAWHKKGVQTAFLKNLVATGNVALSARMLGLFCQGAYSHRRRDPRFAAAWADAELLVYDLMMAEAWHRGLEGIEKPVIRYGKFLKDKDGKIVTIREFSDPMLALAIKEQRIKLDKLELQQVEEVRDHGKAILTDDERHRLIRELLDGRATPEAGPASH